MIRSLALVLVFTTFACKKSEQAKPAAAEPPPVAAKVAPADPAQPQPAPAQAGVDPKAVCIQAFTRSRECTDDFIPALVDARASADQPPGIADAVKKDRDGVIAEAKQEWANDSKDEAIAANCEKIAAGKEELAAEAQACLAKTDCKEFVACAMPVFAKQFGK
jgi:hypothetical protein